MSRLFFHTEIADYTQGATHFLTEKPTEPNGAVFYPWKNEALRRVSTFFSLEKSVESAGASFFPWKIEANRRGHRFFREKNGWNRRKPDFFRWKMGGDSRARSFLRSAMQAFLTRTFFYPTEKSNERTVSSFFPCEQTRLPRGRPAQTQR